MEAPRNTTEILLPHQFVFLIYFSPIIEERKTLCYNELVSQRYTL